MPGRQEVSPHSFGYIQAYCVPEIPSIIQQGGAKYPGLENPKQLHVFESAPLDLQQQVEASFLKVILP